jgi:hypothetical protein
MYFHEAQSTGKPFGWPGCHWKKPLRMNQMGWIEDFSIFFAKTGDEMETN